MTIDISKSINRCYARYVIAGAPHDKALERAAAMLRMYLINERRRMDAPTAKSKEKNGYTLFGNGTLAIRGKLAQCLN